MIAVSPRLRVLVLSAEASLAGLCTRALESLNTDAGPARTCGPGCVPEVVVCAAASAREHIREPGSGRFALAFVSAGDFDPVELPTLLATLRALHPQVRIVCCSGEQAVPDGFCDAVLRAPVDVGQIRVIARTLLDASRARAERDVALARQRVTDRLGDFCHWHWDRHSGEAGWCASFARLMGLDECGPGTQADAIWERVHPDDRARVRARMERATAADGSFAMEYRIRLSDGSESSVRQESTLVRGAHTHEQVVCAVQPLGRDEATSAAIRRMAYFDPLTELPNRSFLNEHLRSVLTHARRHERIVAILHVNLDGFKRINDTLGHDAGDRLLQEVAVRLQSCVRDSDCVAREQGAAPWPDPANEDAVARFGADEFIVVLSEVDSSLAPGTVAQRIISRLREPMRLEGRELIIGASIGIALYPENADSEDVLLRNAALALQSAKRRGRNTFHCFDSSLLTPGIDRLNLEAKLRQAMDEDGLSLHYQPKVEAMTGSVVGAEALLRWEHPELGSVPPSQFIPIAEQTGLILPLGEWVIAQVCRQLASWRDAGLGMVPVSINVSAQQLYDQGLGRKIMGALAQNGLRPRDLEFEITESVLMEDVGDGEQRLRELKSYGSLISMDDFGTGYSSLSYLKRLPIDVVKIDRSFVRDILEDEDDQAILRAIIAMAHQLRLSIVAEGVESEEQMRLLQTLDCDFIQGYVVSRPVPPAVFAERFLVAVKRLAS